MNHKAMDILSMLILMRPNSHFMMYIFVIYDIQCVYVFYNTDDICFIYRQYIYMYFMNILYVNLYMTCIHNVCQIFVIHHRQNV